MKKLLIIVLCLLICNPAYAVTYCKRFPTDTAVACYGPEYPPPAAISSISLQDEGVGIGTFTTLNAAGIGVTATLSNNVATLTIPGGASSQWLTNGSVGIGTTSNVGIGTIAPTAARLFVLGNVGIGTTINDVYQTTSPPNGGLITYGNVGVGTINPLASLQSTPVSTFTAGTGGTITTYFSGGTQYEVHTFNSNGTFVAPIPATNVHVLVVAGGGSGGGGDGSGGGGGAGGLIDNTSFATTAAQSIGVTVGAGGVGVIDAVGNVGNNSVFSSLTAIGGGNGASNYGVSLTTGGSGGGMEAIGSGAPRAGGLGTAGQGNNGGGANINVGATYTGAGGGGAGAAGASVTVEGTATAGGVGLSNSITGSAVFYAGGGGGSVSSGTGAVGGNGGGGHGGGTANAGRTSGTANTGGGGGGSSAGATSGAGGSGVVIVSYPIPSLPAAGIFNGLVGINNNTPVALLDITGVGATGNTSTVSIRSSSGTTVMNVLDNGNVGIGTDMTSATARLSVIGGNVGIGSITPGQVLDVIGTVRATAFSGNGSALTGISSSQWITTAGVGIGTYDHVGIGTTLTSLAGLTVMNGNVGIGTWIPVSPLDITSGSQTTSIPALNITQTWNGSGIVFNALKINATKTLASVNSGLIDASIGGNTFFRVGEGASGYGSLWLGAGITPSSSNITMFVTGGTVYFNSAQTNGNFGWYVGNSQGILQVTASGTKLGTFIPSTYEFGWASTADAVSGTPDTGLSRIASGSIGVGNAVNGSFGSTLAAGNIGIGTFDISGGGLIVKTGNVGIGTLTPGAALVIGGGGVLRSSGTAPTVANNDCGSTSQGTVNAGSTDMRGDVVVGTLAVTSCKVTFAGSYAPNLRCFPTDDTSLLTIRATETANTVTFTSTSSASGDTISWFCLQ